MTVTRVKIKRAIVLSILLLLTAAIVWLIVITWETRDEIPQSAFLPDAQGDPYMMPGAHDATEQVCTEEIPCRWAVISDTSTVMMFDDEDDAERVTADIPGARRSNWIVVDFSPGLLAPSSEDSFMQRVDGLNHSD
ncbi:MAG: hypothetical protein LBM23_07100 [Propionibacteriaceae bacterium]|nr:hypothetical protein [Propionibacteriaceae bacterium]